MMRYFCSLPNRDNPEGRPKVLRSDDDDVIRRWLKAEDRPGFGVYYCPNPLKPGAKTHGKDSTAAVVVVYVDADCKDIVETSDEAEQQLRDLLLMPTWIVRSGHGFHVGWELKEPVGCDDPDYESVCALQAALIEYLAGDPQVRPWSLLRCPGTTNSKRNPYVTCEVIQRGPVVDLSELQEMAELVADRPLLTRKGAATNGRGQHPPRAGEWAAPIDVEARLAAMRFQGESESSIHATQLACTASLLRSGIPLDDVVTDVLEATRKAVASDRRAAGWNWQQEEVDIRRMGCDFVSKNPELSALLPEPLRSSFEAGVAEGRAPRIVYTRHLGWYARRCPLATSEPPGSKPPIDKRAPKKYRFQLIPFGEMRPGTEQNYLVDELFPTAGLALIYGAPKSGKSFWALDVFLHVALGWEYRDRSVQQGPVIYCAFEGAHGYRKRCEAFRLHHGLTDEVPPLFVVPGRADLIKHHAELIKDLKGQLVDLAMAQPVRAVILDTLNKSLIGSESKDVDMANYIAAAEAIQKAFNCIVVIVHHHGIEESRPRGHTSLRGAVDTQIKITRDEHSNIVAVIEDMRDGPEGAQIASRLVVVEVGEDMTGKKITSAAVEPLDRFSEPARARPKLTPNQATMLALLEEAGQQGLSLNEWNIRAKAAGLGTHRKATLVDLRTDLRQKGLVVAKGDVWVAVSRQGPSLDL